MIPKTPVLNSRQFLRAPMLMASSEQNDCSVRALANAADVPYDDAHAFWELHGRKRGKRCSIARRAVGCLRGDFARR